MEGVTLYRPVNQKELDLIKEMAFKGFPPRLPEQPFFYPVMNEEYATQITKDWNVPAYGSGFVTKFEVDAAYLKKYEVQNVGRRFIMNYGYLLKNYKNLMIISLVKLK